MLGLRHERDAILQVPKSPSQSPLPLLIMLHGATQNAEQMFDYLEKAPEEAGVAVLAPNSFDITWDAMHDSFGPDVEYLNRALQRTFDTVSVHPARVSLGGFSDGASYALGLGLINADLFSKIAAFSPGFIVAEDEVKNFREKNALSQNKPRIFISHGTHDHILPIERCGRRVAADLKSKGFDVIFREFDGDHEIPPQIATEAMQFVAKKI
jgi:predicted esterase